MLAHATKTPSNIASPPRISVPIVSQAANTSPIRPSRQLFFLISLLLNLHRKLLHGSPASVDSKLCTLNEAGTIGCQEDNGFGNLVRCSRTSHGCLGGKLFEGFTHSLCAFRAGRSGTHRIDADASRTIFRRPCFGQEIDRGLTRAIQAH